MLQPPAIPAPLAAVTAAADKPPSVVPVIIGIVAVYLIIFQNGRYIILKSLHRLQFLQ